MIDLLVLSNAEDEDSAMHEDDDLTPSPSSSNTTVINDTDSDSNDEDEPLVLKKPQPKHNWFAIPEVLNRQMGMHNLFKHRTHSNFFKFLEGYSSKYQSGELFRRRFYGSLHSVQRLELMYKLEEHEGCVNGLNFHPDGSLLASGSDDLKVAIWDWKIGKCLLKYETKHRSNVFQSKFLKLSGDLHIATCARDGQVSRKQSTQTSFNYIFFLLG